MHRPRALPCNSTLDKATKAPEKYDCLHVHVRYMETGSFSAKAEWLHASLASDDSSVHKDRGFLGCRSAGLPSS